MHVLPGQNWSPLWRGHMLAGVTQDPCMYSSDNEVFPAVPFTTGVNANAKLPRIAAHGHDERGMSHWLATSAQVAITACMSHTRLNHSISSLIRGDTGSQQSTDQ